MSDVFLKFETVFIFVFLRLISAVRVYLEKIKNGKSKFKYAGNVLNYVSENIKILSGEEEGGFAWISTNAETLKQNPFTKSEEINTVGIVEMGGLLMRDPEK